ncbi:pyridoxine 5'-phosphate synthase [Longimonas halophila]|uniref:Pyridoxine 5'-phosphate synthase n=1 Tax=Longimonas halophila TaxID=1469170 RepID=A0A2H3NN08_9BACT|nr:pyridoxine 5'-phosphate synthase [Longimonas halophila]PEN08304.1 pyridoxine 5'-phosphate synthase [Longimonas halophila]
MTVPRLLINIDHVATLRNARREAAPDPVHAAGLCMQANAHGIVFHLREDRRHITERDVRLLKQTVHGKLDFELSTNTEEVDICCDVQPELATLVPERREEVTTEGGLDVTANAERLDAVIPKLKGAGVEQVALFVDPVPHQIEAAAEAGAHAVELHTGDYANATTESDRFHELDRLATGAEAAHQAGLRVHAGHGLNYTNVQPFVRAVPHVAEVSIGFAVISRAVFSGLPQAVRDMRHLIHTA